ncbi:MAG TPA: maleylpyruvate isomerase family mycothiol-dependent enzyme [Streptosporangiaceae bacterium]|jgi:uncharacterized protein (TIGR03083 family)
MTAISDDRLLAEVTSSTATVAQLISGADLTQRVPTCPDWTVRQLATHMGRAHRWAAAIVDTRSAEPIPFREVPDGRLPDDPREQPGWLTDGAAKLAGAVQAAGSDPVWTHLGLHPAGYWARRMAHETAVHRADAQLAFGQPPVIDADIASDGIDEWLGLLQLQPFQPTGEQASPLAGGRVMHLHTTDDRDGTGGEWLLRGGPAGLTVEAGHGKGDVAVRGPASALMLILVRRLPPDTPGVEVIGDRGLLDAWLAATPF